MLALSLCVAAGNLAAQAQKKKPAAKEQPAAAAQAAPSRSAGTDYGAILNTLKFREIGPAIMGGRIDDFAVVESDPRIIYVCTASGGVLKTTNAGTTWEPIFDNQEVSTCGDIAIAPADPAILYLGTGESNNRQSSSWGNGVYKSLDAGKTWTNVGLKETHHIGRVVVHPANPNVAYVAAAGRLWGPSKDRGVYKTTDGGKTWQLALFVNEDTGVNDIAMDPQSPDTLYAAAYQRRRTVFGFNGSGPHSAIYKTTDGGATWKKLTKGLAYENGGETGRIGIDIYRKNTNIVYALIEHGKGGIYRSEDKGETWTKMSDTNPRPMYYSQPRIDPNNDLRIWLMGAPLYFSEDGGKTFVQTRGGRIHGDYHAFWIDPANSEHMLAGTDGGIHQTYDGGKSWDFVNTIPLGQFYEIGVDMQKPYRVCGGLQDNGSWCAPSSTLYTRGVSNDEWVNVAGGDGYYAQIDPTDANIVYAESQDGNINRRNLATSESVSIRPREKEGEERYRFQWNSPIVISRHNAKTVYYGGNFVFKSADRGDTWTKASPDLTNNEDRNKKEIMGKAPDKDTMSRHDGVQQWPCITTISESSWNASVLWAGTDDGNLQVTKDGGTTWKNVAEKVPGLPKGTYVSRVVASSHAEGTAYATFDGHRNNDFGIYVYMTTDFGETWTSIAGNLPNNSGTVHVIREHHKNPELLFAGTEYGAYASFDRGVSWTRIKMNLPTVPVDDIVVHPRDNDLIFGTHGRSIWILDDITPLEQLNDKVAAEDFHLFDVRPATSWRQWGHKASTGAKYFVAPNAPNAAIIQYYLKNEIKDEPPAAGAQAQPAQPTGPGGQQMPPEIAAQFGITVGPQQRTTQKVKITILDGEGNTVRELNGTGQPGINRVTWDLRYRSPIPPAPPGTSGPGGGFGGGGFGGLAGVGSRVDPGTYTIKMKVGDLPEQTRKIVVEEDLRISITAEDRAKRRKAINDLAPLVTQGVMAQRDIQQLRQNLTSTLESWKRPGGTRVPENVQKAADELLKKIDDVYPFFGTLPSETPSLGNAGPPTVERPTPVTQRLTQLAGAIESMTQAPSARQLEDIGVYGAIVREKAGIVMKLVSEDLASLNKLMRDASLPYINVPTGGGGGGGRRSPEGENN
ncbi:MAG: hypothetical protein HY234_01335 [Acidobacteria bacterium]|nr:hypothetical protein [Acidobacteriota bacterium]